MTIATYWIRPTTRSLPSERFSISDQHACVGKVVSLFTTLVESRRIGGRRCAPEDGRDLGFGMVASPRLLILLSAARIKSLTPQKELINSKKVTEENTVVPHT